MSGDGDAGIPSCEALEAAHSFPGRYTIKALGVNGEVFLNAVSEAVAVVGDAEQVAISQRASAKGTYVAVTVEFYAAEAETVRTLYRRLQAVTDLKTLL